MKNAWLLLPLMMLTVSCIAARAQADPVISSQTITLSSTTPTDAAPAEAVANLTALDVKAERERKWREARIPLMPYKPNYFLPYSETMTNRVGGGLENDGSLQKIEAQFQFSFQVPIATGLFWGYGALQIAYTQLSFYQVYNGRLSAPFRESNYEPEGQLTFETPLRLFGWNWRNVNFAFDHQSNGRSDPYSRSWNRAYAQVVMGKGNAVISVRPWVRIREPSSSDDNPDIGHYLGNVEWITSYTFKTTVASVLVRNNLQSRNKGAVDFTFSFPMVRKLRGYIKYFNGYGETLIDYNQPSSRLGVGLSFSDWL